MSRRDYKAIAEILHGMDTKESAEIFKSKLVSKLAMLFDSSNERFRSEKFRLACYGKREDYDNE